MDYKLSLCIIYQMNTFKKYIFLVDGIGALISSLILGLVLPQFETGFPYLVLTTLSVIALAYSVSSFSFFYLRKPAKSIWLKGTAIANIVYCFVTALILIIFFKQILSISLAYFIFEIVIILSLAIFELKLASSKT